MTSRDNCNTGNVILCEDESKLKYSNKKILDTPPIKRDEPIICKGCGAPVMYNKCEWCGNEYRTYDPKEQRALEKMNFHEYWTRKARELGVEDLLR